MYGAVREGGRARDFEEAIEWLVSAGMLNRVYNVSKMEHPLAAFDKLDQFKLFVFDTGLLKHMAGVDNSAILLKSDYHFKGPLTENYVLQQLRGQFEVEPRYFSDKNSEIDFVLQYRTEIIPVEAKGGEGKSAPSFKRYVAQRQPEYALRFSTAGMVGSQTCRCTWRGKQGTCFKGKSLPHSPLISPSSRSIHSRISSNSGVSPKIIFFICS